VISGKSLRLIAKERLRDSLALLATRRYVGAVYLSGYVVELALKARICKTLGWEEFPESRREFESLASFKTHDLDVLLRLSGREKIVKERYLFEWSAVRNWEPELRYRNPHGSAEIDAVSFVTSARTLLEAL
jgi:HEPN domain-containing protein